MLVVVILNLFELFVFELEYQCFEYEYLVFDQLVIDVQVCLLELLGCGYIWFVGVWMGYGFYEDGLKFVLCVVVDFGCVFVWVQVVL